MRLWKKKESKGQDTSKECLKGLSIKKKDAHTEHADSKYLKRLTLMCKGYTAKKSTWRNKDQRLNLKGREQKPYS